MLERISPRMRNALLALLAAAALWFAWTVRSVLNPLIAGYFLAYIVHPLVLRLERRGWSRRRAVNTIFFAVGLVLTLTVFGVASQVRGLARDLRAAIDGGKIERGVNDLLEEYDEQVRWLLELLPVDEEAAPDEGAAGDDAATGDAAEGDAAEGDAAEGDAAAGEDAAGEDAAAAAPGEAGDPSEGATEGGVAAGGAAEQGPEPDTGSEAAAGAADSERAAAADLAADEDAVPLDLDDLLKLVEQELFGEAPPAARAAGGEGSGAAARNLGARAASSGWGLFRQVFGGALAFLAFAFLLPVYTYFLLFELGKIHGFVSRYLPRRDRARIVRIGGQIGEVLASFFRGRLAVCFLKGLLVAVGVWIAGVQYPLLLGFLAGALALVPFVGPPFAGVFGFAVALLDHGPVYSLIAAVAVFGIAELVEGYVLVPKILGESLGLHPVVVLVSVFVGGAALGVFGVLLALPLTASAVILVREFVLPSLAALADEDGDGDDGPGAAPPDAAPSGGSAGTNERRREADGPPGGAEA